MINVLHVTQAFLPYLGGSTIRLLRLIKATEKLCNIKHHVLVTFFNIKPNSPRHEAIEGIHVHRVKSFFHIPAMVIKLNRHYRFDIIHIHNPRPFWFVRPIAFLTPTIIELHALHSLSWHKEVMARFSYRWCNRIFVLGETAKRYIKIELGLPADKIVVIRNGVDYDKYDEKVVKPICFPFASGPKVGYIGTFYRWQGIFELLESAKIVLRKIPDITFIFIGEGPEKEALKRRASEISLERIRIFDQVSPQEVPKYIASLDLFAILRPRNRGTELTLPLKIFEIGMVKTPILLSNLSGLLEAGGSNPEKYFNIQEDLSPQAVGDCIIDLLSKGNVAVLAQKAQDYYSYLNQHDFSWGKSARAMIKAYEETLSAIR